MLENARQLRVQNQALIQLAKNRAISEGQLDEALQHIAFTATALFSVDRVSVWFYETHPDRLDCSVLLDEDFYHTDSGLSLLAADCPIYFQSLASDRLIAASEAWMDSRLSELRLVYFNNHQIRSALSVAICQSDGLSGMLCLEQKDMRRDWSLEEENVARSLADLVALAMEARDRKQAEQALAHAKELAESANRAKSQFLANMSHELRTPLNAVIGFTQVLRRDVSLNTEQQEHINIINRSGEHLLGLINDVLEMSKIEAGRLVLDTRHFDLNRLLETIEGMFRLKTQEKGIGLYLERSPQVPRFIRADESKLRQVLINLIGNAVKFTQKGQITVRLSAHPLPSALQLLVEVADTGSGIAPKELASLFTAFVQTETGRQSQQGTGLGLSISRRFVELMGGHIQVQSVVGQGTLFSFQIPVEVIPDLAAQDGQDAHVIGIAPGQPLYRILVVDDLPENRCVLVKLLSPLGFEVQEAADGQAAIALSESWLPHLIFMDIRMPVMDGLAATRAIKDNPKAHQPIIIALTASVFDEDRYLIDAVGCDDFVSKPFREEHLLAKIGQHLGVEFVYAALQIPPVASDPKDQRTNGQRSQPQLDLAAAIATMPPDWQRRVHQAACCGDDDALQQLVAQMPHSLSTAVHQLDQWINDFQFAPILELTHDILQVSP
ncbi:MAG: ATP-binding protein [Thermosynechococcaceae cyanobacterium]